ncbi:MAG: hypothetical protein QUS08_10095 [Methanothrix sp.]|nr:hypothetical protein [Methanothrix sp.]
MKPQLTAAACALLLAACIQAHGFQNVGEDFGLAWLEQHGTRPVSAVEIQNNLWDWGGTPKGYRIIDGVLYPPGYGPEWYYPTLPTSGSPIVVNNTQVANYISPNLRSSPSVYSDPWLMAQLSGRPVAMVNIPEGSLF